MPLDFLWIKLGDHHALPLTDVLDTSINVHITESIFTPKVGYRLYDGEHLKVDALAGIRYRYTSLDLTHEPSGIGTSRSASWVDGLGGARFIFPLGEKAAIAIGGVRAAVAPMWTTGQSACLPTTSPRNSAWVSAGAIWTWTIEAITSTSLM